MPPLTTHPFHIFKKLAVRRVYSLVAALLPKLIEGGGFIQSEYLKRIIGYFVPWYLNRQTKNILGMAKPSPKYAGSKELVSLGQAIRRARLMAGLSQESLAAEAELDRSYMGGVERGEHNLTLINLCRISIALKIKPSKLLGECGL